jgi:hypothetical protein
MRTLITTTRLEPRPFRDDDTEELHELFGDALTHTIGDGPFTSIEQTRAWIRRRLQAEDRAGLLWYAVRDRSTGRLFGNCGLFEGGTGAVEPEIGYEIRHMHQGQGFASEAAQVVDLKPAYKLIATTTDHLEAKLARMRREQVTEAAVLTSNPPCEYEPYGFERILSRLLPVGARLTVYVRDDNGQVRLWRTYIGNGKAIV